LMLRLVDDDDDDGAGWFVCVDDCRKL